MHHTSTRLPRVAVVTQGYEGVGGVPSVVDWLKVGLESSGFVVDVHDLATSRTDGLSRRGLYPPSWFRRSLREGARDGDHCQRWGGNFVELEPMRYLPRRELSSVLRQYDLIQVVAGAPSLALVTRGLGPPVALQLATLVRWERHAYAASARAASLRAWRLGMTALVSRMEIEALRRVDAVFVENDVLKRRIESLGHTRVTKTPPGVDTIRFAPSPEGWRSDGYLLSVCRLNDPRKGLLRLLTLYADVMARSPSPPALILAGRGPVPDDLVAHAIALGLDGHVRFLPDVDSADLPMLYRGASVYLQASYEEGLGISVLEAMASGIPVVATATAGTVETVVDRQTGRIVPQADEGALRACFTSAVLEVLTRTGPAMAVRSRRRVENAFSREAALEGFVDVYRRLLAERAGA
jgi:glycosyltransferase involved in cell wall biosynthesis